MFWLLLAALILANGSIETLTAAGETQTWDEGIHISAGYAYLTRGDFRWNQEHPPLAKLMSALPLLFLRPDLPVTAPSWQKLDETQLGIDFLYCNRVRPDSILFAARAMTIVLSMLFLVALAWLVRRRFGTAAALTAASFCAFDPNLIAHARYVTTDFPLTVFFFLASFLWMEYLSDTRWKNVVPAAAAFALALVTKFSAILLLPALVLLYVIRWRQQTRPFPWRRTLVTASVFALFTLGTVAVVYWPETLRCWRGGVPALSASIERGNAVAEVLYQAGRWLHLPEHAFLTGLGRVAAHNTGGHSSYLLGMRSDEDWWYYFPVVFAVKSTIAALICTTLLLVAGVRALWKAGPVVLTALRNAPFFWFGLLIPPLLYFAFSMTSAINIGMRHILPIYPFLYVAAAVLLVRAARPRFFRYAVPLLVALQIGECASIAPDYLAFFNVLAGGPDHGPQYLLDSNIDWGQDIKKLKRWLAAHGTDQATILYFGNAQLDSYGIRASDFPAALDEKGWDSLSGYAVASVTPLYGVYVPLDSLARLRLRQPVAKVGWSLYVYDFGKSHTAK
ncbi:MAG: glycosyltransferase family 39 protein [Acidobacteriia bacterium]|nr:glycosyltransferase family 39 protein [Terriglobia bacterium]